MRRNIVIGLVAFGLLIAFVACNSPASTPAVTTPTTTPTPTIVPTPTATPGTTSTPTATPTQATTGGDIGKTRQNDNLRVTVHDVCLCRKPTCNDSFNRLIVGLTIENIGSSQITFADHYACAYIVCGNKQKSATCYEMPYSGLFPKQTCTDCLEFDEVSGNMWPSDDLPSDKQITLVIYGQDGTGQSTMIEFTLPPLNQIRSCSQTDLNNCSNQNF